MRLEKKKKYLADNRDNEVGKTTFFMWNNENMSK